MDEYESNHSDAINVEHEYDQEVSFFLGSSDKPLSLLQAEQAQAGQASDSSDDRAASRERKQLKRQPKVEDQARDNLPVYVVTVTSASDPNIAEHSNVDDRTPEKIMSLFDQTEKQFREEFLSPDILNRAEKLGNESPGSPPAECKGDVSLGVSPCRAPASPTVGLGNLDNLVRMMEVLSVVREENKTLKRKCAYLEDTRDLLQVGGYHPLSTYINVTSYKGGQISKDTGYKKLS